MPKERDLKDDGLDMQTWLPFPPTQYHRWALEGVFLVVIFPEMSLKEGRCRGLSYLECGTSLSFASR